MDICQASWQHSSIFDKASVSTIQSFGPSFQDNKHIAFVDFDIQISDHYHGDNCRKCRDRANCGKPMSFVCEQLQTQRFLQKLPQLHNCSHYALKIKTWYNGTKTGILENLSTLVHYRAVCNSPFSSIPVFLSLEACHVLRNKKLIFQQKLFLRNHAVALKTPRFFIIHLHTNSKQRSNRRDGIDATNKGKKNKELQ